MNGMASLQSVLSGVLCAGMCALAWWAGWTSQTETWLWWLAGATWVGLTAWMLLRGVQGWALWRQNVRWALGLIMLWLAWLAMAQARTSSVQLLLSIFCVVWAADVFAYFFGRGLGGRIFPVKLAPAISPGKSWEGVLGGMLGVFLVSWLWTVFDQTQGPSSASFYTLLWERGAGVAVPALLLMSAMSVVGDLVESLVKRSAGMKDSSGLLPGHGGVLDRVDALLPTLPLAMMLVAWI